MRSLAVRAYSKLPPALQDLAISAAGLSWKRKRYGPEFRRILAWLRETEWWDAERIRRYQDERLRVVVRDAYDRVPYYRGAFDRAGIDVRRFRGLEDLERIPLLTKDAARVAGDQLLSSSRSRSDRVYQTSGTTGTPLSIRKTATADRFQWAVWWRHRARFGVRLGDRYLSFGARVPSQAMAPGKRPWRVNHAMRQTYLPVSQLTARELRRIADWLRHTRFELFAGYPSGMNVLATFIAENGLKLEQPPRIVSTGSETLSTQVRSKLSESFSAPVTQLYGMGESAGGYSECERGALHLDFELGIAELLPIPGADNRDLRRLVLTGLQNPVMPFIRYDVGDLVRPGGGACGCGRSSPTVLAIDGRTEECIRTPDGRRVYGLNQVFKLGQRIKETQVIQDRLGSIEVRIVPGEGFERESLTLLEEEIRQRVGAELEIGFRLVNELPRTASGKLRAVMSGFAPEN